MLPFLSNWRLIAAVALAFILSNGLSYCVGRHDGKASLEAAQLKANIGGITQTVANIEKVDTHYDTIFPTIQSTPSVSKTCALPPAIARTFDLLPDADRDQP